MSSELKGSGHRRYANVEQHTFLYPNTVKTFLLLKTYYEKEKKVQVYREFPLISTEQKYNDKFHPLSEEEVTKRIVKLSRRAGLNITPHDLRRYVQTELEEARVTPNWIKKILGHKVKGEENPYSRPKIEQLRKAFMGAAPFLDYTTEAPKPSPEVDELKERLDKTKALAQRREDLIQRLIKELQGKPVSEWETQAKIEALRATQSEDEELLLKEEYEESEEQRRALLQFIPKQQEVIRQLTKRIEELEQR